jgi:CPA2 family monovalent cation:H+ antiporter-2
VVNIGILRALGEPWPRAFLAGVTLSQIGEFSFVLAGAGVAIGVVGGDDTRLMVAVIALSLLVSPLWLLTARRLQALAARGISGFSETLRLVYGPEARLVREETGRAAGSLRLLAELVAAVFGWRLPPRRIAGLLPAPARDEAGAERDA